MSLAELEAQLAAALRESDEIMAQTFRARGEKLALLTARLEEVDGTVRSLEHNIKLLKSSAGTAPSQNSVASSSSFVATPSPSPYAPSAVAPPPASSNLGGSSYGAYGSYGSVPSPAVSHGTYSSADARPSSGSIDPYKRYGIGTHSSSGETSGSSTTVGSYPPNSPYVSPSPYTSHSSSASSVPPQYPQHSGYQPSASSYSASPALSRPPQQQYGSFPGAAPSPQMLRPLQQYGSAPAGYSASPQPSRPVQQFGNPPPNSAPPTFVAGPSQPVYGGQYGQSPVPVMPQQPAPGYSPTGSSAAASPFISRPNHAAPTDPYRGPPARVVGPKNASSPQGGASGPPARPPPKRSDSTNHVTSYPAIAVGPVAAVGGGAAVPPEVSPRISANEAKTLLVQKIAALHERMEAATRGIRNAHNLREFLEKKEARLKKREEDLRKEEGMMHYLQNVDKVRRAQRHIRNWISSRRNLSSQTSSMLLRVVRTYKESDLAKDAKHRWKALVEIYESEKSYLDALNLLIQHYMRPIERASQQPNSCIEPAQTIVIFNTLDVIAGYSAKMLERLKHATVSVKKSEKMGDVFLQMIPTMALYERYYLGYDDSLDMIQRLSRDKRFVTLLSDCKKASGSQLTLEQLLIMPVQRLPRYAILLEALLKKTPDTHSDKAALIEAQNKVKDVLNMINTKARENETVAAVSKIARDVEGFPEGFTLATNNRRFVKSDVLIFVVKGRIVTRRKPCMCYLFNDMLLRTKQKKGADGYLFREFVPLDGAKLEMLADDRYVTNGFSVTRGDKVWKFMTDSPARKEDWVDCIQNAISVLAKPPQPEPVVTAPGPIKAPASVSSVGATVVVPAKPSTVVKNLWDSPPPFSPLPWPQDADTLAPPSLFAPVKGNLYEYGDASLTFLPSGFEDDVFESHLRSPYYQKYLQFRQHVLYIGLPNGKPIVVAVERSDSDKAYALIMTAREDTRFMIASKDLKAVDDKLLELGFQCKVRDLVRLNSDSDTARPIMEQIAKFELSRIVQSYKFGVIRWCDGQTEDEAFANKSSPAFDTFLESIGQKIRLKGWSKYRGGLNVTDDETGTHSVFAESHGFDMMFHVSTLLPFNAADQQQLERKRHLGNDVVIVVFREPGSQPFDVSQFRSQFNHVWIVVSLHGSKGYRVGVTAKPGVPFFGPRLPAGGIFASSVKLKAWLHTKLINAERAAMHARDFDGKLVKTRTAQLTAMIQGLDEHLHRSSVPRLATGKPQAGASASDGGASRGRRRKRKENGQQSVVNPDDPQELRRRLEELKARHETNAASIKGLQKLVSFYSKDLRARAETEDRLSELDKEQKELAAQISTIEGKLKLSSSASALVTDVVLKNKTDAEKRGMLAAYKAEMVKQEKAVASLEKLRGFYAKDPNGLAQILPQIQKEEAALKSLKDRVSELEKALSQTPAAPSSASGAVHVGPNASASSTSTWSEDASADDYYDDDFEDDEDDWNVDALSLALQAVRPGVAGAVATSSSGTPSLASAGKAEVAEDDFDVDALALALKGAGVSSLMGVGQEGIHSAAADDNLVESSGLEELKSTLAGLDLGAEYGGEEDQGYSSYTDGANDEQDLVGVMMESYTDPQSGITVPAAARVWILSTNDADWTYISGEQGEMYVPSHICVPQTT